MSFSKYFYVNFFSDFFCSASNPDIIQILLLYILNGAQFSAMLNNGKTLAFSLDFINRKCKCSILNNENARTIIHSSVLMTKSIKNKDSRQYWYCLKYKKKNLCSFFFRFVFILCIKCVAMRNPLQRKQNASSFSLYSAK